MKVYIKSDSSGPNEYIVDVLYTVPFDTSVFASKESDIKPVQLPDGTIDEQALADYNCFIDNIYSCLSYYFDIAEIEESPKSQTSWYFWLYGKNKDGDIATKFLVRLRVSDHEYSEHHIKHSENQYVDYKAQELKRPQNKKVQKWKLREIIINGEHYSSYFEAEDEVEAEMEKLSDYLNNQG